MAKMMFWVFGCEPQLDTNFQALDIEVILEFSIDSKSYSIKRYKDFFSFYSSKRLVSMYIGMSDEYKLKIADLFNFKVRLNSRAEEEKTEIPPPAYYFVPYFIDQKKSWAAAWNSFEKLGQFKDWKKTIIDYHVGILPNEYFEYSEKVYLKSKQVEIEKVQYNKFKSAYDIIETDRNQKFASLDSKVFLKMTEEIKVEFKRLLTIQQKFFTELSSLQVDISLINNEMNLLQGVVSDLEADYRFATENIVNDEFECPLCGVVHNNDIFNRSSILKDKNKAQLSYDKLLSKLNRKQKKVLRINEEVELIGKELDTISSQYVSVEEKERIELLEAADQVVRSKILLELKVKWTELLANWQKYNEELKALKKLRDNSVSDNRRKTINAEFRSYITKYIYELGVKNVNLSKVNKPSDHSQIVKEGGAAEGIRAILSYYFSIFQLIKSESDQVISPFVIDTPNQQEQSEGNYDKIVEVLLGKSFDESQVILCAMDDDKLMPFKDEAIVIEIDEDKILSKYEYASVYEETDYTR